jgi:hypothetical protein
MAGRGGTGVPVGTRGGVGRIAAMAIGLAVLSMLVLADAARAGTYEVAQCGWGVGAALDVRTSEGHGGGVVGGPCASGPSSSGELRLELPRAEGPGDAVRAGWKAAPGTGIVGVRAFWDGGLPPGFRQEIGTGTANNFLPFAGAVGVTRPGPVVLDLPLAVDWLDLRISCVAAAGQCVPAPTPWAELWEVDLIVADDEIPRAWLGGPLVATGWHRGTVGLELAGDDIGAGVERLEASAGGATVAAAAQACATASIGGESRATAMRPCPSAASPTVEVDTMRLPDGTDPLRPCAVDFAGNVGCGAEVPVQVDNSAPAVELVPAPNGSVAATVGDDVSGPAAGSIAIRPSDSRTWEELPTDLHPVGPGEATLAAWLPDLKGGAYVVRVDGIDAAGNVGEAQLRVAGTAAEIRDRVAAGKGGKHGAGGEHGAGGRGTTLVARLAGARGGRADRRASAGSRGTGSSGGALTVPFGTEVELRGRLTGAAKGTDGDEPTDRAAAKATNGDEPTDRTAAGAPGLAGRRVRVTIRPARGARGGTVVRRVTTDRRGRFELRLPAGSSRHVAVRFGGGGGFAPSSTGPLDLRVRAAVSLTATPTRLRTGDVVDLRGLVRSGPARIPARGKLVAIQYLERASGEWSPALVDRTDARGRFDIHYRFRYITGAARIRLRATALPEAGWPYAAGSSAPVTVEVRGG